MVLGASISSIARRMYRIYQCFRLLRDSQHITSKPLRSRTAVLAPSSDRHARCKPQLSPHCLSSEPGTGIAVGAVHVRRLFRDEPRTLTMIEQPYPLSLTRQCELLETETGGALLSPGGSQRLQGATPFGSLSLLSTPFVAALDKLHIPSYLS